MLLPLASQHRHQTRLSVATEDSRRLAIQRGTSLRPSFLRTGPEQT